jgi:sRNA-binding protein
MFKKPVTEAEAPGYFDIISQPMDLSTIRAKSDTYQFWEELATDLYTMYNNAMRFNPQGSALYKASKAQQMHARSLLENARAGRPLVSAKARAASKARKETMAARKSARETQQAMNKRARAEQKAAQEAKILRRAGIKDGEGNDRETFRRQPDSTHYQYKGLAGAKTGDNVWVALYGPSFDRDTQAQVVEYGTSLSLFAASLSAKAFGKARSTIERMAPRRWTL